MAHQIPHPKTWIFHDYGEAKTFFKSAELPIVFKPDFGDTAKGIKILRSRKKAFALLKRVFSKGLKNSGVHPCDKQWGNAIFQEYISHESEWRMVRIGDSYFGYQKIKVGDFASGSHKYRHVPPLPKLLNIVRKITECNKFRSMNVDILVRSDGECFVNELQTLFGATYPKEQCVINGEPGRIPYNPEDETWSFEKGKFCENHLCNLRVEYFLKLLDEKAGKQE